MAKVLRTTVATAKRNYWKIQVEQATSPAGAFKLMRWGGAGQLEAVPLSYEGKYVTNQLERANILRDSLLARHQAADDLPPCSLSGEGHIPWFEELNEDKVRACTIGSGNTCPGADGISVELLTACWDSIKVHVTNLFRACLHFGHHPSCFKLAEVVFLPKAGRDPTSVKGWRPISLLS